MSCPGNYYSLGSVLCFISGTPQMTHFCYVTALTLRHPFGGVTKYILGPLYKLLFEFPFVGLWFDLEISYNGSFLMTLETKMNLTRLGKEGEGLGEQGKEG